MTMVVDILAPVCNGVHFDDAEALPRDALLRAIAAGTVFCTEFAAGSRRYGGTIVARSIEAAEMIAAGRGLGERVVGTLCESRTVGAC